MRLRVEDWFGIVVETGMRLEFGLVFGLVAVEGLLVSECDGAVRHVMVPL